VAIFLTGVGCVGKTTVGEKIAALLGIPFFDLDVEIESYFGTSIARLQNRFLTQHSYRKEASKALKHVLSRDDSRNCVMALPPSGLMDSYWRLLKNSGATIVVLVDSPENILNRIVFYDLDSKRIDRRLSEQDKRLYLKEIKADISYFRRTYQRANMTVDIAGLGPEDAARKVCQVLNQSLAGQSGSEPEPGAPQRTGGSSFASAGR
jgi:shikimate kinase